MQTQNSPIAGIRFVHTAIRRETSEIEKIASTLSSPVEAEKLAARVEMLAHEIHLHTQGEELSIFPTLETKEANIAVHYVFDHHREDELLKNVKELAEALKGESTESKASELRSELRRAATSLRYHAQLHIKKEEEIIVPMVQKHFAPPEQGAIVKDLLSRYRPEELSKTLPWTITWLDADDREKYVRIMQAGMPPQAFVALKGWLKNGTPPEVWSDLSTRVPELAQ